MTSPDVAIRRRGPARLGLRPDPEGDLPDRRLLRPPMRVPGRLRPRPGQELDPVSVPTGIQRKSVRKVPKLETIQCHRT